MSKRTKISERTRFEVLKRDGFRCVYCGAGADTSTLHIDHRDPVANGGTGDVLNLVTACKACNSGKGPVVLDKPDPKAQAMAPERLMAAKRCPDHNRRMEPAHYSSFHVYARRPGTVYRCPVKECRRWAIAFRDSPAFNVWPTAGLVDDVSSASGSKDGADQSAYVPEDEVEEMISESTRPAGKALARLDLETMGEATVLLHGADGLAVRWGWSVDEAARLLRWWGWQE